MAGLCCRLKRFWKRMSKAGIEKPSRHTRSEVLDDDIIGDGKEEGVIEM
jgi:hypothetical protein